MNIPDYQGSFVCHSAKIAITPMTTRIKRTKKKIFQKE
jgi:hypothetical protein